MSRCRRRFVTKHIEGQQIDRWKREQDLEDFKTVVGTVKVGWVCPVIEICSRSSLRLSVLGLVVFLGHSFEGRENKKQARDERKWTESGRNTAKREEKQWNRKDPGPKTFAPCFRRILVCVIHQTCALAWKHNSPVIWISHTRLSTQLLCDQWNVTLSFIHTYLRDDHPNGRNIYCESCWQSLQPLKKSSFANAY